MNDVHVPRTVIRFLGAIAILSTCAAAALVFLAVQSDNQVDAAVIALIGSITGIATSTITGLAAILATTGKGTPQPVTVENSAADPVPTQPQPVPAGDPFSGGDSQL